ncbi:hypothetical protein [Salinibacterium sp.]|uniref:hypothetical protein n=1 Tax=Salinibacterium sp. TaxID=1915057 RepID=UPI00286D5D80|nr:hypothetical protein [Salinibacterium sp.]
MELLFVSVIGACIGGVVRYSLPKRGSYGAFLLPAAAAAVTATVWVALLWVGLAFEGTWIWVASIGAGAVASLVIALALPRTRTTSDAAKLRQLAGV